MRATPLGRTQSLNAQAVAERSSRRSKLVVTQVDVLQQQLAAAHAKITTLLDERSREATRADNAESVAANLREKMVAAELRVAELTAADDVRETARRRGLEERASGFGSESDVGVAAAQPLAREALPESPLDNAEQRWEARRTLKAVEAEAARRIGAAQRDAVTALARERERAARERERNAAERERIAAQLRRADALRLAERRGRARNDVVLRLANSSLKARLCASRDDLVAARSELVASRSGAAVVALGEARLENGDLAERPVARKRRRRARRRHGKLRRSELQPALGVRTGRQHRWRLKPRGDRIEELSDGAARVAAGRADLRRAARLGHAVQLEQPIEAPRGVPS